MEIGKRVSNGIEVFKNGKVFKNTINTNNVGNRVIADVLIVFRLLSRFDMPDKIGNNLKIGK